MAVPPGNKQVGSAVVSACYSCKRNATIVSCLQFTQIAAVVDNVSNSVEPPLAKNKLVNTIVVVATYSIKGKAAVNAWALAPIAIVRSTTNTILSVKQLNQLAVITDPTQASAAPVPPRNAAVCTVTLTAAVALPEATTVCESLNMVMIAVLREFKPRHEHITISVEYGDVAQVDTGGE